MTEVSIAVLFMKDMKLKEWKLGLDNVVTYIGYSLMLNFLFIVSVNIRYLSVHDLD